jgi:hypothetical protein
MFLCEILTEQQQAPMLPPKAPPQHIHVHVQQPAPPKEKKEKEQNVQQQEQPQQAPVQTDQYGNEYDPEMDNEMQEALPFQEILPMKRYYLIGRVKELKTQLDHNNIKNDDFEIIMKFINNLSYNSIVSLSSGIIPVVEDQIARLSANAQ